MVKKILYQQQVFKNVWLSLLTSNKAKFRIKKIIRKNTLENDKSLIHQAYIIILNIYALRILKYIKQKLIDEKILINL